MKIIRYLLPLLVVGSLYAEDLQLYPIHNFSGGLNSKLAKNLVPPHQCYDCLNILFDETLGIKTRAGYESISSTVATKIFSYNKQNGEKFIIKWYQNALDFSLDGGNTFTNIRSDIRWQDGNVQMAVYNDQAWFVSPTHYPFYFDGNLNNENEYYTELEIGWLKGKYILSAYNKLLIANTYDNPSNVYFVTEGADPTDSGSWEADSYFVAGFQDGDVITGLYKYRTMALIFKRYSLLAQLDYFLENEPILMSSNYGALNQEVIASDKGTIKFLSHEGVKEFNGSGIVDIDLPVENIFADCNNLAGEYYFLHLTNSSDFNAGTIDGFKTDLNELKLKEYPYTWDSNNFNGGTTTNTLVMSNFIKLSTATEATISAIAFTEADIDADVYTLLSNGAYVIQDGKQYIDDSGDNAPSVPPELDFTITEAYKRKGNIIDTDTTTQSTLSPTPRALSLRVDRENTWVYTGYPTYKFTIAIPNKVIDKVDVKSDLLMGTADILFIYKTTSFTMNVNVYMNVKLAVHYTDGTTPTESKMMLLRAKYYKALIPQKIFHGTSVGQTTVIPIITKAQPIVSDNVFSFNLSDTRKVDRIEVEYYFTQDSMPNNSDMLLSMNLPTNVSPVYDISVYETTSGEIFKTSGYYLSVSTHIAKDNVKWGKYILEDYSDYDNETTTITYQVQSSTDNTNWSAFQVLVPKYETGFTVNTGTGTLTVPDGRYMRWGSSYTTTVTTYTPVTYSFGIEAIKATGTWISKKYNVGKAEVWNKFIVDSDLSSQNATYWVKLATGSTALDGVSFSTIASGDTISTSTNTWIQYKAWLETTDGKVNPIIYSLTSLYAPTSAPILASALSIKDRYWLAISTISSGTTNDTVMVYDKQRNWTKFDMNVSDFMRHGNNYYFADESAGIYKLETGTTDGGTAITSEWRKRIDYDKDMKDKELRKLHLSGLHKGVGTVNVGYIEENSSTLNNNPIAMTGTDGNMLIRLWNTDRHSGVRFHDIVVTSTSPIELHKLNLFYEEKPLLRR